MDTIDLPLSKKEAERDEKLDAKGKFAWEEWLKQHKFQAILAGLGIFLLGIGVLSAVVLTTKQESSSIEILPVEEETQASEIFIHVSGAVEKPGLYQLNSGARVNDALVAAGGLASSADREWFNKSVNLAQKLSDGVKLHIPFKGETPEGSKASEVSKAGIIAGEQTSIFVETQGKININTVSLDQLDSLSGIGPIYAQRIIDARPFSKVEDIIKVAGIGEETFAKIKDKIMVF